MTFIDAQYWAEEDGDFDEQNTDQWDIDTSEFYGGVGDRDAKDFINICKEQRFAYTYAFTQVSFIPSDYFCLHCVGIKEP